MISRVSRPGRSQSDHIMAPYKLYKFCYYDLAMIGLEAYIVQSMIGLEAFMIQSMISLESYVVQSMIRLES